MNNTKVHEYKNSKIFESYTSDWRSDVHQKRCNETPHGTHRPHRTTSRRERRVTGRFAPLSVRPTGRIQRFLNVSCLFS